ncbi:DUF262 domain-containing protein [Motilibacter rhizosphaerae]|uniref:DUF262 domain-containing protein n=1 Tax=Motilibacter rhizosphaerae TaxID=598652 RepID=UPI0038B2D2FB
MIPLWQRHYSWERTQLLELWSDLERVQAEGLPSHFLGSIVLKALPWSGLPSEARRFLVVDGPAESNDAHDPDLRYSRSIGTAGSAKRRGVLA